MNVLIDDVEYTTGVNLTNAEFYQKLKTCKNLPKTTQVNQMAYVEAIQPYLEKGQDVFVMAISSGLSGSYNSLRLASEELNSEHLAIFDTETVTFEYKALVMEAVRLIEKGITLQDLVVKMEYLRSKSRLLAVVENVKYLIKGGRLSRVAGMAVTALNIKPIIKIEDKLVKVAGKAIGFGAAMKTMCKSIVNLDKTKNVLIAHSDSMENAQKLYKIVKEQLGVEPIGISEIGAVVGTHAGPGAVGVVYFEQ